MTDELEIKNAIITKTFIGIEDHGMLTFYLYLEGPGWSQGFGGYRCDNNAFLPESIQRILAILELDSWEKLKGTYVRIQRTRTKIYCIGHILEDKWYDIVAFSKKFT